MKPPQILRGLLGWSNKRPGLEVYRWNPKLIPRHESEWGDLLVAGNELRDLEGCPLVMVVLPRNLTEKQIADYEEVVTKMTIPMVGAE